MTWTESVESYLAEGDFSDTTGAAYRRALVAFRAWFAETHSGEPDPALITDEIAVAFRDYLAGERTPPLSASSVNLYLTGLRGLARSCGNRLEVESLAREFELVGVLTSWELGRLFDTLAGEGWMDKRDVAIVSLMGRAGLHLSEVLALLPGDVDWKSGSLSVRGGDARTVPLSPETSADLQAYLDAREQRWGRRPDHSLILSDAGEPLGARTVQRMIKGAARRANIAKDVRPRVLRRTFATHFLAEQDDKGVGAVQALATLQKVLGHKSLAATARYMEQAGK